MKTRKPFKLYRCRHEQPGDLHGERRRTCAVGLDPDAVAQTLTLKQRADLGYGLPRGWPCTLGQRAGLACAGYAPWTPEEIEADEQRTQDLIRAVASNRCVCGAPLVNFGTLFRCSSPTCEAPVSGFACGHSDIRG